MKVDALRAPTSAPRQTYRFADQAPDPESLDPLFSEAQLVAEQALAARGMFPASRPEWADVAIEINFSVSPQRLKAVPDLGGEYSNATSVYIPERGSGPVTESTGVQLPPDALKRMIAVREKRFSLSARENLLGGHTTATVGQELWRVEVSVEDESDSLTDLLPVLGTAMIEHIDTSTAVVEHIAWSRKDAMVLSAAR